MTTTIETTVDNGSAKVRACGDVYDPEPEVGLMSQYVENLEVTYLNGDPIGAELSDDDEERIVNELIEAHNEPSEYLGPPDRWP